ncbi:MAG: purine permease, partial [Ruthenibacterium sp.]
SILIGGVQMITRAGFTQRNTTIASLSIGIGIGFTQIPELFSIFPQVIREVFAGNPVAVVFVISILLNLVLPKDMEIKAIGS